MYQMVKTTGEQSLEDRRLFGSPSSVVTRGVPSFSAARDNASAQVGGFARKPYRNAGLTGDNELSER